MQVRVFHKIKLQSCDLELHHNLFFTQTAHLLRAPVVPDGAGQTPRGVVRFRRIGSALLAVRDLFIKRTDFAL